MTTALLIYGMEPGLIDCVLVAGFSKEKPWKTEAKIATTPK
ncbi:MAG: coenzyme F420 hydrogenase/dehydrogenase beta subunit N-terminal domain-containing protein [Dehalococcoidales bacterium]|nr:coenzyme F420 hydrogenase/dehydrogenase beta subunit N-terminal domain-containing protein [Dehalococcoidales bacterium]